MERRGPRGLTNEGNKALIDRSRTTLRAVRNALMRAVSRPDYDRWTSPEGLERWWSSRTDIIAGLVPPDSRIIEFGAGRRHLEQRLPPGCTYTALDLADRGPGTIICDLNRRPLPDLREHAFTVAVFAGVLEYLKDVRSLVDWLGSLGLTTIIVSFDPVPSRPGVVGRFKEQLRRLRFGYMCNMTEAELLRCFESVGMQCTERCAWTHQLVMRFDKSTATPSSSRRGLR